MKSVFIEKEYSQHLCFSVIVGSDDLIPEQEHTDQQDQSYKLIKFLHDGGMGVSQDCKISKRKSYQKRSRENLEEHSSFFSSQEIFCQTRSNSECLIRPTSHRDK